MGDITWRRGQWLCGALISSFLCQLLVSAHNGVELLCLEQYIPLGEPYKELSFRDEAQLTTGQVARRCGEHCINDAGCTAFFAMGAGAQWANGTWGPICQLLKDTQPAISFHVRDAGKGYPWVRANITSRFSPWPKSLSYTCLKSQADWDLLGKLSSAIANPLGTDEQHCVFGVSIAGVAVRQVPDVAGPIDCSHWCTNTTGCIFWTFNTVLMDLDPLQSWHQDRPMAAAPTIRPVQNCWLNNDPYTGVFGWTGSYNASVRDPSWQPDQDVVCLYRHKLFTGLGYLMRPAVKNVTVGDTIYTLFPEAVNFTEANNTCARIPGGGRLAMLDTQEKLDAIELLLATLPLEVPGLASAWIGVVTNASKANIHCKASGHCNSPKALDWIENALVWQLNGWDVPHPVSDPPIALPYDFRIVGGWDAMAVDSKAADNICGRVFTQRPPLGNATQSIIWGFDCGKAAAFICESKGGSGEPFIGPRTNNAPENYGWEDVIVRSIDQSASSRAKAVARIVVPVVGLTIVGVSAWCLLRHMPEITEQLRMHRKRAKGKPRYGDMCIAITDIEGYTNFMRAHPDQMLQALVLHNQVIEQAVYGNCGYVLEQEGDSYILLFHEPGDAVAFALQVQQALMKVEWPEELSYLDGWEGPSTEALFKGVRVRVGVARGRVRPGEVIKNSGVYKLAHVVGDIPNGGQVIIDEGTWSGVKEDLRRLGAVEAEGLNYKLLSPHMDTGGGAFFSRWRKRGKRRMERWGSSRRHDPPTDLSTSSKHSSSSSYHACGLDMGMYELPKDAPPPWGPTTTNTCGAGLERGTSLVLPSASIPRGPPALGASTISSFLLSASKTTLSSASGAALECSYILGGPTLRLYQVLPPALTGRALLFRSTLALPETWQCIDPPYFAAPGLASADFNTLASLCAAPKFLLPWPASCNGPSSSIKDPSIRIPPSPSHKGGLDSSSSSSPQEPPVTDPCGKRAPDCHSITLKESSSSSSGSSPANSNPQLVGLSQGGSSKGTIHSSSSSSRGLIIWKSILHMSSLFGRHNHQQQQPQQQKDEGRGAGPGQIGPPRSSIAGLQSKPQAASTGVRPLRPVTMMFVKVECGELLKGLRSKHVRATHNMLKDLMLKALVSIKALDLEAGSAGRVTEAQEGPNLKDSPVKARSNPGQSSGGYLVKAQDGELKYMLAFSSPATAVAWAVVVQEAAMFLPYPDALMRHPAMAPQYDTDHRLVFRGLRLKMGLCEGLPKCIIPDHAGRADYFGPFVNQAARYADAAAHGGQVVTDAELAAKVFQEWKEAGLGGVGAAGGAAASPGGGSLRPVGARPLNDDEAAASGVSQQQGSATTPPVTLAVPEAQPGGRPPCSSPSTHMGRQQQLKAVVVEGHLLGSFAFKGSPANLDMVAFHPGPLLGRKFPPQGPKGKGFLVKQQQGLVDQVQVLLPSQVSHFQLF